MDSVYLQPQEWWEKAWIERNMSVQMALGQTSPPGNVHSFSWDDLDLVIPGACAMSFAPNTRRASWMTISLGLTQPLDKDDTSNPWEFCLHTKDAEPWRLELLYDLITTWAGNRDFLATGHFLPVTFFINSNGVLDCALQQLRSPFKPVGAMRGLYLWPDLVERPLFEVSTGDFHLMSAVLVTEDEERLADETSPPHLLLLLKRCGVGQLSDPHRKSTLTHPQHSELWKKIRRLSHDEAFDQLCLP